jgi:hypothetical protein
VALCARAGRGGSRSDRRGGEHSRPEEFGEMMPAPIGRGHDVRKVGSRERPAL